MTATVPLRLEGAELSALIIGPPEETAERLMADATAAAEQATRDGVLVGPEERADFALKRLAARLDMALREQRITTASSVRRTLFVDAAIADLVADQMSEAPMGAHEIANHLVELRAIVAEGIR